MNNTERSLPLSVAFAGSMIGYSVTSGSILYSLVPFLFTLLFGVLLLWTMFGDMIQGLVGKMESFPNKDSGSTETDSRDFGRTEKD